MMGYRGKTEWDEEIAALTKKQSPGHPLSKNEAIRLLSLSDRIIGWHDRDGEVERLKQALTRISDTCQRNGEAINHQWVISVAKEALRDPL